MAPSGRPPGTRRRWPWIVAAIVVVVAVAVAAVVLLFPRDGGDAEQQAVPIGVPGQVLLPSLREQPVVGWRVDLAALLPDVQGASLSARVAGHIETRGYFKILAVGDTDSLERQWVVGIDLATGTPLFAPVELGANSGTNCYVNGPQRLVCTSSFGNGDPPLAWVIDSVTGAVIYTGPTDLKSGISDSDGFKLTQIGDYVVAAKKRVGWYGVGDQGQTTWFVAGLGDEAVDRVQADQFPGDRVANIAATPGTDNSWTVFSSVDGSQLISNHGAGWLSPLVGGGFVVMDRQSPAGFQFYDARGARVGEWRPQEGTSAELAVGADQLAVVTLSDLGGSSAKQVTLTGDGRVMAETNSQSLGYGIRIIGDYMFAAGADTETDPDTVWNKFDLKTGNPVSSCAALPLARNDFVGSDGTVVLGRQSKPGHPLDGILRAVDSNTCQTLWQIPNPPEMITIGTTLVQTPRGEISSLVPPA